MYLPVKGNAHQGRAYEAIFLAVWKARPSPDRALWFRMLPAKGLFPKLQPLGQCK
ncbi:hypothetical protein C8J48_1173 [Desmospora activa DSM 45169]|uniref:Uncharacterized protein n=1 Tax=Desmospora activa DSM 45169 TaxID=1121389 RepID=A0A2T4Z9M5_9BACL|nr:hypothetical protein C8J48_1173 [Desmospora activa DSM 45169]